MIVLDQNEETKSDNEYPLKFEQGLQSGYQINLNNESNSEIDESMLLITNKIIPLRFQRYS